MNRLSGRILILLLLFSCSAMAQKPIRIVCIGGSDTHGVQVANRTRNAFPAQLQNLLGRKYDVLNFGVEDAVLFPDAPTAYQKNPAYKNALKAQGDIVVMSFGSRETALLHQYGVGVFETTYGELIHHFQQSKQKCRILLLKATPAYTTDTSLVNQHRVRTDINPALERLAMKYNVEIVDCYGAFVDRADLFPDGIHVSSLGAAVLARHLYDIIRLPSRNNIITASMLPDKAKQTSFYGYEELDFNFTGRDCRIVKPKRVAAGNPWIWRARFWGHEPQTDIALLERGFHLVYCDVAELYGNKESIRIWDAFYDLMQQFKLSSKVVFEAMSRGGIYAYNWALAHPERVAAIYADAPVLDLKSWPGGKGKGPGSVVDWELFKNDYGLSESAALAFTGSPLDRTNEIIPSRYPILHVVGDADEVVPVAENTALFEERLLKGGRAITVIHKPGVKHHPHSLANPAPIVDFILRATGYKTNFANLPAPGAEYRSGAGWKEGADWWKQQEDINTLLITQRNTDILFVGNSITQGIGGERPNVTYKPGKKVFDSLFGPARYISAGISGDRTQQILWRLQHGPLKNVPVEWIVLTIGVNNFWDDEPGEIVAGIKSAMDWLRKNKPESKLILVGPLPAGMKAQDPFRKKYESVHQLLRQQLSLRQYYQPLGDRFILPDGSLDPQLYSSDGIHLLENGYVQWALAVKAIIAADRK